MIVGNRENARFFPITDGMGGSDFAMAVYLTRLKVRIEAKCASMTQKRLIILRWNHRRLRRGRARCGRGLLR